MIAKLTGILESAGEDWLIIDVGGVGYLVFASGRTLSRLPGVGEAVRLFIETHVREDHIHLYGFLGAPERDWFRLLQTVQGVGAKVALAILSVAGPDDLGTAIAAQDKTVVSRASGVGPKLAARIVNELKDKVARLALAPVANGRPAAAQASVGPVPDDSAGQVVRDAVSALTNLGYRPGDAYGAVAAAARGLGRDPVADDLQALIRQGLKELAQ